MYSGIRKKISYGWQDTKGRMGLHHRKIRKSAGSRILVYHGLCPSHHTRYNSIFLTTRVFEQHLKFFKEHFNLVSLDDYFQGQFRNDRFNVCITFDDGFANNFKYVLPLVRQYNIPVCFFVTGIRQAGYDILWNDFLALFQKYGPGEFNFYSEEYHRDRSGSYISTSTQKDLKSLSRKYSFKTRKNIIDLFRKHIPADIMIREQDYWKQMTEREMRILSASPLVTIGCHGYTHVDLSEIPISEAKDEMADSKKFLENVCQKEIRAIAFPYGTYTREVLQESKHLGFEQLLATEFIFPEDHSNVLLRERFIMNPYISVHNQILAILDGKYKT